MSLLTFAIPSKGRLKDQTEAFLLDHGFRLRALDGERGYRAALDGAPPLDLILLSAREIAERLLAGTLHLGVTGEDLLNDLSFDLPRQAYRLKRLGFGHARVVVAVPACWADVDTLADLEAAGQAFRAVEGRRLVVATKYPNITRRFFAAHSVTAYRLVDSAGATEAAPAAGTADLIVDITTSGATLRANHLKTLADGTILDSEAALTASLGADWSDSARKSLEVLLDILAARADAPQYAVIETEKPFTGPQADEIRARYGLESSAVAGDHKVNVAPDSALQAAREIARAGYGMTRLDLPQAEFAENNALATAFNAALAAKNAR